MNRDSDTKKLAPEPIRKETQRIDTYASLFWYCEPQMENSLIRIVFGWAMPDGPQSYNSGYKAFMLKIDSDARRKSILPSVEEPSGMLHFGVGQSVDWHSHCERLVADYQLFFVHRTLFGQAEKFWPISGTPDTVDKVLVFGPTLSKFRGRVCYSHHTRTKTVAILAPDYLIGQIPGQTECDWAEASPTFWHDCATRRWTANPQIKGKARRISAFDLIVPTSDGMTGALGDTTVLGQTMWQEKAAWMQTLLESDREPIRLAMWGNREVFLPRGMADAAVAAVIQNRPAKATDRKKDIEATGQKEKKLLSEIVQAVDNISFKAVGQKEAGLRSLLAVEAYDSLITGQTLDAASRTMVARKSDIPDAIEKAKRRISEKLGESISTLLT